MYFIFYINNTSFRIGTEIFSSSTQLNTYGWYSLTTTDTELYSATCPTFTSNTFKIYAKKTSTSLIVRFEVIDGDISGVDPDITDLTFNSQQFYSSSLNPTFTILPLVKSNTNSVGGLSPKVNSITPNLTSIREGSTVTFTITTSNITTDTTYYWKKTSSSSIPDSRLSVVSGSIIIGSSNTATKSITINTDQNNYVDQTLSIQLYVDSGYTTSLGVASELVTIVGSTKFYSMTTPASITGGDFMNNNTAAQVVEASAGAQPPNTKVEF